MWVEPTIFVYYAAAWLLLLAIISLLVHNSQSNSLKHTLFWLMLIPTMLATLYLGVHTVYDNVTSETKGPVHWHADYEVWVCGSKLDLIDPVFPRNKIGSPLLHEHDDDRMHVEGTVSDLDDLSLGSYFNVIGGQLTSTRLVYPTNEGMRTVQNGDFCDGEPATLKVYVNGKLKQDASSYVLYPSSYVPPGDCIVVSFDTSNSSTTDRICTSWTVEGWNYGSYTRAAHAVGDRTW